MSSPSQPPAPDRRRFLLTLGMAGLSSALLPPVRALAQAATPPSGASAKRDSAAATASPPEPSADARSLAEIVRRRYGDHLSPEQMEAVTRELDNRLQGGKRLRETKLANGDEPDVTFHA